MEVDTIALVDSCRLCAKKTKNSSFIYDPADNEKTIIRHIRKCLPNVIPKINGGSDVICKTCKKYLQKFYDFRNTVVKANMQCEKETQGENLKNHALDSLLGEDVEDDENYMKIEAIDQCFQYCSGCNEVLFETKRSAYNHKNCKKPSNNFNGKNPEIVLDSIYKCEFCDRCFIDSKSAKIDKASHIGDKPYVCLYCDAHFQTRKRLSAHNVAHKEPAESSATATKIARIPKYYLCRHCDKTFLYLANMNIHEKGCIENKWQCGNCGDIFADSKGLIDHKKKEKNAQWHCRKCSMSFGSICGLMVHKKKPHPKRLSCSYCNKEFGQKSHLTLHILNHTGEKPFACNANGCDMTFKMKTERNQHKKIHAKELTFKCNICDKSFANSARRRQHIKFHSDPKPFKCTVCAKGFKRHSARKIHMSSHTGERAFACDKCDMTFKRKADMKTHKKKRH